MARQRTQESVRAKAVSDAELMRLVRDEIAPNREQGSRVTRTIMSLSAAVLGDKSSHEKFRAAHESMQAEALDWRRIAKLAANDLKAYKDEICFAAETGQRQFFIDLGKCLLGEMKSGYDKLDADIAQMLSHDPSLKAAGAVRILARLGHPRISEENFRMRKKRLKSLAHAVRECREANNAKIDELAKTHGVCITKLGPHGIEQTWGRTG